MTLNRWPQFASALASIIARPPAQWSELFRARFSRQSPSLAAEARGFLDLHSTTDLLTRALPTAEPISLSGLVLRERYVIERHLGSGGMCEVYLANDLEVNERVAIKLLLPNLAGDPYLLALLRRELRISRAIQHPSVCRTFGIDETILPNGQQIRFIVMEFLDGETLASIVSRGPLMETQAKRIVTQILEGLAAAHAVGVLHGDMKCLNVIMAARAGDTEPRAVITDFGLARRLGPAQGQSATLQGKIMGTAAYMPPEQFAGLPLTAAADLHAVGVIFFRMLTGRLPFEQQSWHDTARMRATQKAPFVRSLQPSISHQVNRCVARALEADPADRPQTADEMVSMLAGSQSLHWTGRSRRRALIAGVSLVPGAVLTGVGWTLATKRIPQTNPVVEHHLRLGEEFVGRRTPHDFQQALQGQDPGTGGLEVSIVPVARQNLDDCQRVAPIFIQQHCDMREAGLLYTVCCKGSPTIRKRILIASIHRFLDRLPIHRIEQ